MISTGEVLSVEPPLGIFICETATPPNEWDSPNPGTVMVGFEAVAPASGELGLDVLFTPGSVETNAR